MFTVDPFWALDGGGRGRLLGVLTKRTKRVRVCQHSGIFMPLENACFHTEPQKNTAVMSPVKPVYPIYSSPAQPAEPDPQPGLLKTVLD